MESTSSLGGLHPQGIWAARRIGIGGFRRQDMALPKPSNWCRTSPPDATRRPSDSTCTARPERAIAERPLGIAAGRLPDCPSTRIGSCPGWSTGPRPPQRPAMPRQCGRSLPEGLGHHTRTGCRPSLVLSVEFLTPTQEINKVTYC